MADEENPLGGGPFGVGPFGPLVGAAAAAAAAFYMVPVTISQPVTRTLFYQAKIEPPPATVQQAEEFLPRPAKWMPRWQGPPKYQPNRGPFAVHALTEPPAVVDTINAATGITTGGVRSKSLFYQAKIEPPVQLAVADNTGSFATWYVQVSRAAPRPPVYSALYTPFVPKEATRENTQTPDKWMVGFLPAVPHAWPTKQVMPFVPREAVLDNTATPDKWLPTWRGPPNYNPAQQGGAPFVPREAVLDNTVTPDKWLVRWQGTVPVPPVHHTQPFYGYPYVAASNLTTTLEWMVAWPGPKRPLLPLAGGVVNVPLPSNLTTTLEWQVAWRGPPRVTPAPQGGSPFVPKEAVLENTVTPDKWLARFQGAVPVPSVHHTQPVLGYPYQAASNLTTTLEWMAAWQGPPRYWPIKVQALPFVPKADIVDQVTPDKWLQAWRGPPRAVPAQAGGSPFVPKEAVLENTVTPDKWLVRFAKAVPTPKPVPTQPEFRYPYETQAIVVPYEQWWHQPLSRPAARPSVHAKPYQPFVPKEAVAENTQTPDKWLQRWQGPPRYRPLKVQTPPFVPREATLENTQTPDKWHRDLGRAVAKRPVTHTQPGWSYAPVVADNTVTIEKWQQPLSRAATARKARPTQPLYVTIEPEVVVVEAAAGNTEIVWTARYRKSLFYQSRVQPYYPYEQAVPVCIPAFQIEGFQFDAFQTCFDEQEPQIEGGPADEPERVACILPHSRVAVVPEVLRTATVPVDLRVATVPELSRTVEVLLSDRDEDSNKSQSLPCAGPIVFPGGDAFDDAFEDDAFQ